MPFTLTDIPDKAKFHLLLAHGAGAGADSPFMQTFTHLLLERHIGVTRIEFDYMSERRTTGKRRPPPRAEILISEYEQMIRLVSAKLPKGQYLIIGGKSLGGRIASMLADHVVSEGLASGLVCLGYPFHPPNKPEKLRTAHLETIKCPSLILQGERDPFGNHGEVNAMNLSPAISVAWIKDGDHDLVPRAASGQTHNTNMIAAADRVAAFLASLPRER